MYFSIDHSEIYCCLVMTRASTSNFSTKMNDINPTGKFYNIAIRMFRLSFFFKLNFIAMVYISLGSNLSRYLWKEYMFLKRTWVSQFMENMFVFKCRDKDWDPIWYGEVIQPILNQKIFLLTIVDYNLIFLFSS